MYFDVWMVTEDECNYSLDTCTTTGPYARASVWVRVSLADSSYWPSILYYNIIVDRFCMQADASSTRTVPCSATVASKAP